MADLIDPILTIAIPTYNRAKYLNRCLYYVTSQISKNENLIELIVSDNNSVDETNEVVQYYINLGYNIRYFKNSENFGPDINIDRCYELASGKYVLALGDDDILTLNSINKLLDILKQEDYGVVFLKSNPIESNNKYYYEKSILNCQEFQQQNKFLEKISYNITFISANIINKSYYDNRMVSNYYDTNLVQVPFIMEAILCSNKNLIVNDCILKVQVDNTGGYKLFKVFGTNFDQILLDLSKKYPNKNFKDLITDKLLTFFFPFWIIKLKKDQNFASDGTSNSILMPLFKKHLRFWIYCYPLEFMPYKLAVIYNFITLIPPRIYKYINRLQIFHEKQLN